MPGLALAQGLGVVLADLGWLDSRSVCWLALAAGVACLLVLRRPTGLACVALALACSAGAMSLARPLALARRYAPVQRFDAAIEARVCERRAWGGSERPRVRLTLCGVRPLAFGGTAPIALLPARLELFAGREESGLVGVPAGALIRARVRVAPVVSRANPGARDNRRRAQRAGVGAGAQLVDPTLWVRLSEPGEIPAKGLAETRASIGERLVRAGPGGALLRALALGDRSSLERDILDAFARLGISHLLSVSGLHLALTSALVYSLALRMLSRVGPIARRADPRRAALLVACAAATLQALMAGFGVPVRRALVLVLLAAMSLVLARRRAPVQALSAAVMWVLATRPGALFELGPQLSFALTAALLLALRDGGRNGADRDGFFAARLATARLALQVSATAVVAGVPLLAAHGVAAGAVGVVLNVIAVPWTALVQLPLAQAAALIASLPLPGEVLDALIRPAGRVGQLSLWAVEWIARPLPQPIASIPTAWALVASAGIALVALRVRRTAVRVALALACAIGIRYAPPATLAPEAPRLVALDVGLGDALIIQARDTAVLVDGGWASPDGADLGRSVVAPALRALGIRALDLVVATHADADHVGGLVSIVEAFPVRAIWIPRLSLPDVGFDRLRHQAQERGVPVLERSAADPPEWIGALRFRVLWPADSLLPGRNDQSLVLRVDLGPERGFASDADSGGGTLLLTGDLGVAAERKLVDSGVPLRADILKVGHHGSRGSSSEAFMRAVSPRLAIVSAPCSRRGGLPTREALDRVRANALQLWWTGRHGALIVPLRSDQRPRVESVRAWSAHPRCEWP